MGSKEIITLMRLLEMSESRYTVGTFSFSNGLESASNINLIAKESTLQMCIRDRHSPTSPYSLSSTVKA